MFINFFELFFCLGEAQYANDIPHFPNELQGALVITKIGKGRIDNIDPSPALVSSLKN